MIKNASVLVVDDVPANLGLLLDALSREYRVMVAESGEGCLEQLPYSKPDIVLMDMLMPGMSGLDCCAAMQGNRDYADIPVIFMTAVDDPEQKRKALQVGAVDYVTKPVYIPEVMARLATHLKIVTLNRSLQRQNEALELEVQMRRETDAQLEQSIQRALIVATDDGQVLFASRRAVNLMQLYYNGPSEVVLPDAFCAEWHNARKTGGNRWLRARSKSKGSLVASVFHNDDSRNLTVFYLDEEGAGDPLALTKLGLSPRESEVLFWIAEGKTYPEISEILGAATRTVHKHAENLMRKLNVESRSAAMRIALDAIG